MLACCRCTACTSMQSVFDREKTRAEIDHVLAILLSDLIKALMNFFQAFDAHVAAEQIRLQRVRLEVGEKDTAAAIQCLRIEDAIEVRTHCAHDELGQGSGLVQRELHAVKAMVLCFYKRKNTSSGKMKAPRLRAGEFDVFGKMREYQLLV